MARATTQTLSPPRQKETVRIISKSINWPLMLGGVVVLLVLFVAITGPALAPRDPMERTFILRTDSGLVRPPYPLLTPGYPLGSDDVGRDTLSRLLWAIRPTMLMVGVVALVRLSLGMFIGMFAGWSTGRFGRTLDTLLAAALAIPTLLVALGAIAFIGVERGLLAFVIGMALTGWAETARLVREQTQIVKSQPYIQAAHALGASDSHILILHISRHILPMGGMLLAFEISATLVLTGALAFLGYFIGGGIWIQVTDATVRNLTGLPELGQMLATALVRIDQPTQMVLIGSVIFIMILGFNLLGEGLRQQMSMERLGRRASVAILVSQAGSRLEEAIRTRLAYPIWRVVFTGLLVLLLIGTGSLFWRIIRPPDTPVAVAPAGPLDIPGGHAWAAQNGDAFGTLRADLSSITDPQLRWSFQVQGQITGSPAIAADGTLYIATDGGILHALDSTGNPVWQATLPAGGVGGPALDAAGTIYVTDRYGGLSAVAPDGTRRWYFQSDLRREATSGPIVAADGSIYYTVVSHIEAVAPDGTARWQAGSRLLGYTEMAPRLSPDGELVFLKDLVFATEDGSPVELIGIQPGIDFSNPAIVVGGDGVLYYHAAETITPLRRVEQGLERVSPPPASDGGSTFFLPEAAGVAREGLNWFLSSDYFQTYVEWKNAEGVSRGFNSFELGESRVIGVADDGRLLICGTYRETRVQCLTTQATTSDPLWSITLDERSVVTGGAVTAGRIYITTDRGLLHAME